MIRIRRCAVRLVVPGPWAEAGRDDVVRTVRDLVVAAVADRLASELERVGPVTALETVRVRLRLDRAVFSAGAGPGTTIGSGPASFRTNLAVHQAVSEAVRESLITAPAGSPEQASIPAVPPSTPIGSAVHPSIGDPDPASPRDRALSLPARAVARMLARAHQAGRLPGLIAASPDGGRRWVELISRADPGTVAQQGDWAVAGFFGEDEDDPSITGAVPRAVSSAAAAGVSGAGPAGTAGIPPGPGEAGAAGIVGWLMAVCDQAQRQGRSVLDPSVRDVIMAPAQVSSVPPAVTDLPVQPAPAGAAESASDPEPGGGHAQSSATAGRIIDRPGEADAHARDATTAVDIPGIRDGNAVESDGPPGRELPREPQTADRPAPPALSSWRGLEIGVPTVLPFLILGPLARMGLLDALAGALLASHLENHRPALGAALARKVLPPPIGGWQAGFGVDQCISAVLGGADPPDGASSSRLADQTSRWWPIVQAELTADLVAGRTPRSRLVEARTPAGSVVADAEGFFPLLWNGSQAETDQLREIFDPAIDHLNDESGTPDPLEILVEEMVARPASGRRGLADGLDPPVSLLASTGLAALSWDLWSEHEATHPLLALFRFADLDGTVSFDSERVSVRMPMGRRHHDLRGAGLLEPLDSVPWLPGRRVEFFAG